jgi:ligand-binding SRPBCC domain-containing protein
VGRVFTLSSDLSAPAITVWRHAVSPDGVNSEFRPLLRMTFPPQVGDLTERWRPGKKLFRSWILVAGLLPVEYDDIVIEEVDPGRRFLERSSMLTQRVWEHERVIEPCAGGCRITDRVLFEPRLPGTGAVFSAIFKRVFQWRHRNLRRLFNGSTAHVG